VTSEAIAMIVNPSWWDPPRSTAHDSLQVR